MEQYQNAMSAMPAFMAGKLMMGMFRGATPALILAATAAAGGAVYGAIKAGQGINKYIQKTKVGNNKGSKLLRDLEDMKLTDKEGKPIPVDKLVSFHKVSADDYKKLEKMSERMGLPFSAVKLGDKNNQSSEYEVMIMKKHSGILKRIITDIEELKAKDEIKDIEAENQKKTEAGQLVFISDSSVPLSSYDSSIIKPSDSAHNRLFQVVMEAVTQLLNQHGIPSILNQDKPAKDEKSPLAEAKKDIDRIEREWNNAGRAMSYDVKLIEEIERPKIDANTLEDKAMETNTVPKYKAHQLSPEESKLVRSVVEDTFKNAIQHQDYLNKTQKKGLTNEQLHQNAAKKMEEIFSNLNYKGISLKQNENSKDFQITILSEMADKKRLMDITELLSKNLDDPKLREELLKDNGLALGREMNEPSRGEKINISLPETPALAGK